MKREEAEKYLSDNGYGKGTNFTVSTVAYLMEAYAAQQSKMPTERLQELMNSITAWSDGQFGEGQRNPAIAYHLLKEVPELIDAIKLFQNTNSIVHVTKSEKALKSLFFEYADCLMLLLDSASHMGLTADMLIDYTQQKLEINKSRKWGKPDENGVVEHID